MSWHLRTSDQRWLLSCDRTQCTEHILATPGSHEGQRVELDTAADMLGWYRTTDVGDYCPTHARDLPLAAEYPLVPREELCQLDTWCIRRTEHEGACKTIPRAPMEPTDFGPRAATSTRRGG